MKRNVLTINNIFERVTSELIFSTQSQESMTRPRRGNVSTSCCLLAQLQTWNLIGRASQLPSGTFDVEHGLTSPVGGASNSFMTRSCRSRWTRGHFRSTCRTEGRKMKHLFGPHKFFNCDGNYYSGCASRQQEVNTLSM